LFSEHALKVEVTVSNICNFSQMCWKTWNLALRLSPAQMM